MSETAQTTQTAALPGVKWYRRKQSVVPGVTWESGNYDEIRAFAVAPDGGECFRWRNRGLQVWNDQEQTWFSVPEGHTVIRGALCEYYPVSPEALARTYGPADDGGGQVSPDLSCAQCGPDARPRIVCLCGSTRFYDQFQQANYDLTMQGAIVLSVGFYPHAKAAHGHGEGVGHDSAEKAALDELHKRKIDLADEVLVVSDESGYFGSSTAGEIRYAVALGKPVRFDMAASEDRAMAAGLLCEPTL